MHFISNNLLGSWKAAAFIRAALSVCPCLNVYLQSWSDLVVERVNEEEGSEKGRGREKGSVDERPCVCVRVCVRVCVYVL